MVSAHRVHHNAAMTWQDIPPLYTGVDRLLPALPQIQLVAARVTDHSAALRPEERPAVERAAPRRIREFATGRLAARRALDALGLPDHAIPRADGRAPCWPAGVVGSITHTRDLAVAGAALAADVCGLGIDLEGAERVGPELHARLFTARERAELDPHDAARAALLFSAKEAGYKAVYPNVGRFIGFHEAEVAVDPPSGTFRLRYVGDHRPNRIMDAGEGLFCQFEQYVLTVFMIPAQP